MTTPNTKFEISVEEMEIIEDALRAFVPARTNRKSTKVSKLLGRLHNQKIFFRPKHTPYVSG